VKDADYHEIIDTHFISSEEASNDCEVDIGFECEPFKLNKQG
jgi:hypothetical protein